MRYDDAAAGEAPDATPAPTHTQAPGAQEAAELVALLAALASDLPGAYPQVVMRYQRAIYTFALRLTGAAPDAEDLAQEAFVSAYVSLENYPPERIRSLNLRPWLYRVALNVWRHAVRGARLRLVPLDAPTDDPAEEYEAPLPDDPQDRPEAIFAQRERRQELEALVARLPERYRVAITCYYLEDLSYQEVADLLDQPVGTVKSTIHRGLRLLRNLVADSPIAPHEDYHCVAGVPPGKPSSILWAHGAVSQTSSNRQNRRA